MSLVTSIRERQYDLIEQNPADITINRVTRTEYGGGWTETSSTVAEQTVRIYNKKVRALNLTTGGWHSQRLDKMIAEYDADIKKESATNLDTFTHNGIKYKVVDVKPITTDGEVVFLECALEEVT